MKAQSVWNRNFLPILLTYFIDTFGLAIVYPIFAPLFLRPGLNLLGAESLFQRTFLLGLLIASFPLAQFFSAPIIGMISDHKGRKRVFIWTILGGSLGYFLTGFGIYLHNLPLLWCGRITAGSFAGNLTLCLSAVADISQDKKIRARNFGWIGTVAGLGFILAIFMGGSLSDPDLYRFFRPDIPFYITGCFSLINLFLLIKLFRESHLAKPHDTIDFAQSFKHIAIAIKTSRVRWFYITYFLFTLCWIPSLQFLSTYLIVSYAVSVKVINITFASIGITWAFSNFILNRFVARFVPASRTFDLSLLLLGLFLYLTLIPHEPLFLFLIHFFFATLFAALAWTNGLASISIASPKNIQGGILGVNQSIVAIASIIGPIIGGFLAGMNINILYVFTAACSLLGGLLLFIPAFGIKKV